VKVVKGRSMDRSFVVASADYSSDEGR